MRAIEFYTTPSGEVTIKEQGQPERQLKESDTDFIQSFLEILEEFYPEAYAALRKYYARYDGNKCYRDFLAVRRFIKCNFGLYDNMIDVDENWYFKFEFVGCPLRGECDGFKKICEPKFNSTLSDSQLRVMELCYYGKKDEEIAETLFISSHTVKNHRKNVFRKLSIHSMAEFMRYANEKNLFKGEYSCQPKTPIKAYLLYERSRSNTLLGKSQGCKRVSGNLSGKRKRTSVSGGRTWKNGSRKVGYNVTSDRAKSSTGWKTCISAP